MYPKHIYDTVVSILSDYEFIIPSNGVTKRCKLLVDDSFKVRVAVQKGNGSWSLNGFIVTTIDDELQQSESIWIPSHLFPEHVVSVLGSS